MYWITGKEGLLGKAICQRFNKAGIAYVATARNEVDITCPNPKFDYDVIINCAAYTAVDRAEEEIARAHAVNVQGVQALGRLGKKVIHFSTEYVFDGEKDTPYAETDKTRPLSIYGKTKLEGEARLLEIAPDSLVIRTSWLFGKEGGSFLTLMQRLMKEHDEVFATTDQWGRPTSVEDIAEVLPDLVQKRGILHLVNQGATTRFGFAEAIAEQLKFKGLKPTTADTFKSAAKRPSYGVLGTEKAARWGVELRPWQEALVNNSFAV
ncbi:MAG: dTDP-4-dehydrorhamnose reductase [Chlamydiia bacterium]|nr:dTDP-4-dehydrorhamnose reductase [Chlamydiia bacterium]MCH9616222.1 dTDP-4-dehydrorhamnose reductase [Chlamydiia bacterium]MCH9629792.1 dTDP-4-dehydrorhamnose reductase [Chlamydiia bacterium]